MDNALSSKIREAIGKSNTIGIVVGQDPMIDEMAAALSLYLLLRESNKNVTIACPTEPIVELSSLVGIDKVQNTLSGDAGDLIVSFPYAEGEIEKVSYTLEDGYLNIIVKAAEEGLSFDDKEVRYTRGSGEINLLFVIGTPRLSDLGDVFDPDKLKDVRIVNIDNKADNQGFGDIVHVSQRFSTVSEQIADLALSLGMHFDNDIAQNLLSGITAKTRNFQDPATSSLAFEMAAFLMKKGATRSRDMQRRDQLPREDRQQQGQGQDRQQGQGQDRQQRHDRQQGQNRRQQYNQQQQQFNQRRGGRDQQRHQQSRGGGQNYSGQQQNRTSFDEQRQQQKLQDQLREEQNRETGGNYSGQQDVNNQQDDQAPPADWLAPKVYKGSNFEG